MLRIYKVGKEAHGKVQGVISTDAFARNGYIYREGKTLGFDGNEYYLYIEGNEDFFKEQEESLDLEGIEELEGGDFEKVKTEIEKEQGNVASGISLFD